MSMLKSAKLTTLVGLLVVLVIIAGLLLSLSNISKQQRVLSVTNFEECRAAGFPVMESYPEQCMTPDGRSFVNTTQEIPAPTSSDGSPIQANGCAVAGCSGQLCISAEEAAAGGGISTCEFRPEYGCYREASCEPQADGKCGWTRDSELRACLANPPALERAPDGAPAQAI